EAAAALDDPALRSLAERYAELGRQWTELAHAALRHDVPAFKQVRTLYAAKAELIAAGAPAEEVREIWRQLGECRRGETFPLSPSECSELRAQLRPRILALHEAEVSAQAELGNY